MYSSQNPEEKDKIQNIQLYFMDSFQYHNPIHRGILIDLLLKEKNDTSFLSFATPCSKHYYRTI